MGHLVNMFLLRRVMLSSIPWMTRHNVPRQQSFTKPVASISRTTYPATLHEAYTTDFRNKSENWLRCTDELTARRQSHQSLRKRSLYKYFTAKRFAVKQLLVLVSESRRKLEIFEKWRMFRKLLCTYILINSHGMEKENMNENYKQHWK